jgi:hypothetical protein
MKDIIAVIKDSSAALKDVALVACLAAVLLFPDWTKAYLRTMGLTSLETPFGSIPLAESQMREGTAALTALDGVRREVQPGSDAARAVDMAVRSLQAATLRAQEAVAAVQPAALPSSGWMYLGTSNSQRTDWKAGTTQTVIVPYASLHADRMIQTLTDVNLREDRPSPDGNFSRVIRVVRIGQEVRILEIDATRPADPANPGTSGYRVWAKVDVAPSQGVKR